MGTYPFSLSVFFPAHNEVDNIGELTEKTVSALTPLVDDFEILIVNDGSTDGTRELADELEQKYSQVRAIHHEINRGYGGAVKTGFQSCTKDWIFFADGDGQFNIHEIGLLLEHAEQHDAVVGYRINRQDPFHRKVFAFCWGTLIKLLFGFRVRDLDCAFKLMRRHYFDGVEMQAEGAVISVEIFSILKRNGAKIKEVGVHHYPRKAGEQSGGNPKVVFRAFKELIRFYGKLKG